MQLRAFTQLTLLEPQRGIRHRLDARDKLRQNWIVVIFSVHKLQRHAEIAILHIDHAAEGLDALGNSSAEVRPHDKHHVSEARAQDEQLGDARTEARTGLGGETVALARLLDIAP